MEVELLERDLASIAKSYGKVYDCGFGDVSYTSLEAPKEFLLESGMDDRLRFYLYRRKENKNPAHAHMGIWESAPGCSTIAKEGLPTSEQLIKWRVGLGAEASDEYVNQAAEVGTHVHAALEDLYKGKGVDLVGRNKKERWCIISGANFLTDMTLQSIQTEQIVAYDEIHEIFGRSVRVLYAGTVDLLCEIWNEKLDKWETWLIDYKTSKEVFMTHRIQVLGYAEAAIASGRVERIDRIGILLLGKKTKRGYQLVDAAELGAKKWKLGFGDFLTAYYSFLMMNGGKFSVPTYKVFPLTLKVSKTKDASNTNDTLLDKTRMAPVSKAAATKKNLSTSNIKTGEQATERVPAPQPIVGPKETKEAKITKSTIKEKK